jgi:hypothetical protein
MKTSLVLTTIYKPNKNIITFSKQSKKLKWDFIVIGDKKTPDNFKITYGNYFNYAKQKKIGLNFSIKCPANNYARKNIGYLLAIKNGSEVIIETDDDNCPKKNFFSKKSYVHKVPYVMNKSWVNIYDVFKKNKKINVWPRGLPLDELFINKIKLGNNKKNIFYLQQGVCEGNPDVDAIYRLLNKKINISFRSFKVNLGNALSTFNSQNTIWFKPIFPLLYLPVTCSMRCTDIWRSLVALKILQFNNNKILFFGTTMFQKRNIHDLNNDFKDEVPMYLNNKNIFNSLSNLKLIKGDYLSNLLICYKCLIKNGYISKKELIYLRSWISDFKNLKIN